MKSGKANMLANRRGNYNGVNDRIPPPVNHRGRRSRVTRNLPSEPMKTQS